MIRVAVFTGCLLLALVACDSKKPPEVNSRTEQRTDYTPEEFGIGRRHTPDKACNRQIDALLDGIRLCYQNNGLSEKCDRVQQKNNGRIKSLKHSIRCMR